MLYQKAKYYIKLEDNKVQCVLCPHNCILNEGKVGKCLVRRNEYGELVSETYGQLSALSFDPIEKKPLYHFYPGREIFSIGSIGCNMKCNYCQNWEISQNSIESFGRNVQHYLPEELVRLAANRRNNIGIAYTYNEPTVFFEYMTEVAQLAREKSLRNVMVTNGFINPDPLNELMDCMDAFSVDLKAFTEIFYKDITKSRIEPVLEALRIIAKNGKHLEITNLVIPTLNDNAEVFETMVSWVSKEISNDLVLHLSRYYPTYHSSIEPTPIQTLIKLEKIARKYLKYVYLGNVAMSGGNNTNCPYCNALVVERNGYDVSTDGIGLAGECLSCGHKIFNYI